MVDIHFVTAENRWGKKEERRTRTRRR